MPQTEAPIPAPQKHSAGGFGWEGGSTEDQSQRWGWGTSAGQPSPPPAPLKQVRLGERMGEGLGLEPCSEALAATQVSEKVVLDLLPTGLTRRQSNPGAN